MLTFGFVLSGTLACAVPLYNLFGENVQLQQFLATTDPQARTVRIQVASTVHYGIYGIADTTVRGLATNHLGDLTKPAPLHYVLTGEMTILHAGNIINAPDTSYIRLEAADYGLLSPHIRIIAGRAPHQVSADGGAEATVTAERASFYILFSALGYLDLWQHGSTSTRVELGSFANC
ncbi:MAG TPA: hypothetical protein VGP82_11615 [Ktedonobacterales bacterium]|nr:hypothetical protein [Ktedonobacterales bacterium]